MQVMAVAAALGCADLALAGETREPDVRLAGIAYAGPYYGPPPWAYDRAPYGGYRGGYQYRDNGYGSYGFRGGFDPRRRSYSGMSRYGRDWREPQRDWRWRQWPPRQTYGWRTLDAAPWRSRAW